MLNVHDSGTSGHLLQFQIPKEPSNKKIRATQSPKIHADEMPQGYATLHGTLHRTISFKVP